MIASALLTVAIAWLYATTLGGLAAEWFSSPESSYGLVVAAVALAVLWRRRTLFVEACSPAPQAFAGPAVLLSGLGVYLVGQLGADVFLTRVSFVVVLTGAVWFAAGGRALRVIAAPLWFLLVAIPLPALIVNAITLPLELTASRIAEGMLNTAGLPVFRDGNVLELPSTTLEVAEACSGLRSILSLAGIAGLLAWAETSWPRRLGIVAASLPVAIVMNSMRIAATGLACEYVSPNAASDPWHSLGGWLTFVAAVAVLTRLPRALTLAQGCASGQREALAV